MKRTAGISKQWGIFAVILSLGCGPPIENDICKGRQVGDLVVTEILPDPDGTDTGNEYIELYNNLGTPIELKGFSIYWKKPDGTGLKTHLIRAGTVPARGYFTLGDVRDGVLPAHIGYSYEDDLGGLPQADGVVGIRCKDLVFDETTYTQTNAGMARTFTGDLAPDATANDSETNWCDAPDPSFGMNFGSPALPNPACPVTVASGQCLEGGVPRAIVPPVSGDLLITEVMADPRLWTDADGEWIEVRSASTVDLNGLVLSSGASKSTLNAVDCLTVSAGGYAVFAASTDAGIPALGTFSFSLSNGGGTVNIGTSDAGFDSLTYGTAVNGVSWQLDPTKLDAFSNDDPMNLCRGTQPIFVGTDGGDLGTPGAANTTCPAVSGNTCIDPGTGNSRAIVSPVVGDVVITEFMSDPAPIADTSGEWFEVVVKNAVDLNGLLLKGSAATTVALNSATCVRPDAGTHVVFARSADPAVNGGLPPVAATITFALAGAGSLTISNSDGGVLDTLAWTSEGAGISTQLDVNKYDPVMNDTAANLCRTDAGTYGALADGGVNSARGTPGRLNHVCL